MGLLLLTVLEYRVVSLLQQAHLGAQIDAARGVLSGHPHWKVYQSRLLGPMIVLGLSHLIPLSFSVCYRIVCFLILGLANTLCFVMFKRAGWAYVLSYAVLFMALQDREWLYLWDYIDLVTMLLFAGAVFRRAPLGQFALLFAVELLNRESALFVALWLVLDAVTVSETEPRRRVAVNGKQVIVGLALAAVGGVWTHLVRDRLLVRQVMVLSSGHRTIGDELWQLPYTLDTLRNAPFLDALMPFLIIFAIVLLLRRAWQALGEEAWKISLLLGTLIAAISMFTLVTELRVWFETLPFLLWLAYWETKNKMPPAS